MSKSIFGDTHKEATEIFNSMPDEDRYKARIGTTLTQLTTIVQIRLRNKEAFESHDRKLRDWQKNVERHLAEYVAEQKEAT